jgi:hypothetical protein
MNEYEAVVPTVMACRPTQFRPHSSNGNVEQGRHRAAAQVAATVDDLMTGTRRASGERVPMGLTGQPPVRVTCASRLQPGWRQRR